MVTKRPTLPTITVVLTFLSFLMGVLLITMYDMTSQRFATPLHLARSCDCEGTYSESMPSARTKNGNLSLDDIPMRKLYDKIIETNTGRKPGAKMNISLLSAFEHPNQIYVMMTSQGKYGDTIYCRYFDRQQKEIGPAFETIVFPEFTANCIRRAGAKYMSLTDSANSSYEFPVPIIDRRRNVATHYFSVCLAPLYGTEPKWLLLAEFIEHHKIQGVTHFYIYVKDIDDYNTKLLNDYVRTGEAEIIALHDRFVREPLAWQYPELQECLIRSRGHSRWVAFIDLDERLTTTEYNGTLLDFLQNISDPAIAELSFRQQWVLRNETTPRRFTDKNQNRQMDCQVDKKSHFRHLLFLAFNRGQKASETIRNICAVYGEDAVAERTARDWFARSKHDNFNHNDSPRSGRPVEMDEDQLGDLLRLRSPSWFSSISTGLPGRGASLWSKLSSLNLANQTRAVPSAIASSPHTTQIFLVAKFMPTRRFHNTSHIAPKDDTAKYIVDPTKAIGVGIHQVDTFLNGTTRYYMKPEEAVIRHYRDVHAGGFKKHALKHVWGFGEFSMTDYPERYMETLQENVQRRLHHVYGGMQ